MSRLRGVICVGLVALAAVALAGCSAIDLLPRQRKASYLASQAGWAYRLIPTRSFDIVSYASPQRAADALLTIYVEGDGLAFLGSQTVSADPTPEDPLALRLALALPGRASAYLARPCQYTMPEHGRNCRPKFWTSGRYAPEVIDAMDEAVTAVKEAAGARRIVLVGYSGGGAVAVLLAARRRDVAGIVTIGADLDLAYWAKRDHLAPFTGSLDPAMAANQVTAMPQIHFVGSRDDIVEPDVVRAYLSHLDDCRRAKIIEIEGFDHSCCWVEAWPRLAKRAEFEMIPGWIAASRAGGASPDR